MCSTSGSTVVIPAPALASSSGPSDGSTMKSPAGALTASVSPSAACSCRNDDTRPSGAPSRPLTRRTGRTPFEHEQAGNRGARGFETTSTTGSPWSRAVCVRQRLRRGAGAPGPPGAPCDHCGQVQPPSLAEAYSVCGNEPVSELALEALAAIGRPSVEV